MTKPATERINLIIYGYHSNQKHNSSKAFELEKKTTSEFKITWNSCILDFDYAAYKKSTFNRYIKHGTNENREVS